MWKNIAIGVGLVVLTLEIAVVVHDTMPPAEPRLQVGMSAEDVRFTLGRPTFFGHTHSTAMGVTTFVSSEWIYPHGPDWLGNSHTVVVHFNQEDCVTGWETQILPRTPPPWLDRVLKFIGW
jgi:hypothetical protein